MSSTTESELESRVRELTESLIHKQTMVEALSTEKNSLHLQLERLGVTLGSRLYVPLYYNSICFSDISWLQLNKQ